MANSILRFTTAGDVDDGKSTLIGRLLLDGQALSDDQIQAVRNRNGSGGIDLAMFTDGLRQEREQGITMDVAYRYFSTTVRKFIIADAPGHFQYVGNMVTAASTADVALILIDAVDGPVEQSFRHACLASLLGVPRMIVVVNKMDLLGYREEEFLRIVRDFTGFTRRLEIPDVEYIPISALHGDNVVSPSPAMPWYRGMTLLKMLEQVAIGNGQAGIGFRFPIQQVVELPSDAPGGTQGYAGRVVSGRIRIGQPVVVSPGGTASRIASIRLGDRLLDEASASMSVLLTLENESSAVRGDVFCSPEHLPEIADTLVLRACWLDRTPLQPGSRTMLRHNGVELEAMVSAVHHRIDVTSLAEKECRQLGWNEIGKVTVRLGRPVPVDPYRVNRTMGSLIFIDEKTGITVGAGMVE